MVDSSGNLNIIPSKTSSPRDFDFLVGKWTIHNRKLRTRLRNSTEWTEFEASLDCRLTLLGFANTDVFRADLNGVPFEGLTLRLFNPKTKLWSIFWADSNTVALDVPIVGSFDGPIGTFFSKESWEGVPVVVQFKWDQTNPETPVWSQAFSPDDGKTWEWNWHMTFRRISRDEETS